MNSRERLLMSLQHKEPDRIPVDSGACSATSISAVTYGELKRHLGVKSGSIAVYDVIEQLAMPEEWYLERFGIDVVDVTRSYCAITHDWRDWSLADGTPAMIPPWVKPERSNGDWLLRDASGVALAKMPQGGYYFDQVYWPLLGAPSTEYSHPDLHLARTMWGAMSRPLMDFNSDPAFPHLLAEAAKRLYETTTYGIMLNAGISLFETGQYLCRTDEFLADLILDRAKITRLLDRLVELALDRLDTLLQATGPYIQVIKINDDFGMQTGPMISPRVFREVFKPRHKVIYDFIRQKRPEVFIFLHSCGSIYAFLPDLIEIGLDIINPVQTSAAEMEPSRLKREFGKDLTFWGGGVDTQRTLPFGSPAEVRTEVLQRIRTFAPGGGFVFTPVQNIQPQVPIANLLTMFETVRRNGTYPVR
jgi:uroporphyrinogen decarboxylase